MRQQQPHLTKPIAIVNQCLKQKAITKQKTIEEDIIHCVKESLAGNYIKTYKQKQNERYKHTERERGIRSRHLEQKQIENKTQMKNILTHIFFKYARKYSQLLVFLLKICLNE